MFSSNGVYKVKFGNHNNYIKKVYALFFNLTKLRGRLGLGGEDFLDLTDIIYTTVIENLGRLT